ncbi:hypothetical protein HDU67_002997 [Dinochytrium kinnereticum]|nr:hypothetical protein HDU67_002997 [Dinochytrium kinnereticum]
MVVLKEASPAQREQSLKTNFEAWGGPQLNIQQYLERENYLSSQEFCRNGWCTWVLVNDSDVESLDLLSHCETYKMETIYTDSAGGKQLGTFITYIQLKGPNCCQKDSFTVSHPSSLLHKIEEKAMHPKCSNSWKKNCDQDLILDVGPVFYDRIGWKTYSTETVEISIAGSGWIREAVTMDPAAFSTFGVKFLDESAGLEILAADEIKSKSDTLMGENTVLILPTANQFRWLFARSRFYAKKLRDIELPFAGAKDTSGGYLLWAPDFKEEVLEVARFSLSSSSEIGLLKASVHEAARLGFSKVRFWGSLKDSSLVTDGVVCANRDDSIPALNFWGTTTERPKWIQCEKLLWI